MYSTRGKKRLKFNEVAWASRPCLYSPWLPVIRRAQVSEYRDLWHPATRFFSFGIRMENRFGLKDFFLFSFLILLGIIILLSMKQYDRQWEMTQDISRKVDDLNRDIRTIQDGMSKGVNTFSSGNNSATQTSGTSANTTVAIGSKEDPFQRLHEAQKMPGYARGDWLVYGFGNNVAKLTPLLSSDLYAERVQEHVQESLVTRDKYTLEWKPALATAWTISPDGLRITFKIRPGVKFSDGEPLTADDVVFTYKFIMDEKIACPRTRAYIERIKDVVKSENGDEVTFIYAEPYFESFLLAAGLEIMPKHFYGKFKPEEFNQSVGLLMGSGAYRMENPENWKPGNLIQLVRNERYWGEQPALDRLVFKEFSNEIALQTAFSNGDVDLMEPQASQYYDMVRQPPLVERSQHFDFVNPEEGYRYVAWNEMKNGKPTRFADKRVRRALTMLVNRDRLIQEIMLGYAVPTSGPFSPVSKQNNPDVKSLPFDIGGAKELLAAAGFTKTNDEGILLGPDGTPFEFKLTYPSGTGNYEKMIIALKDSYAKAGIKLNPDPLEWASFTDRLNNKNFEAITLGWGAKIESDIYQEFHSSQMKAGGDDFMSYRNEELDKTIDEARRTVDEGKRMVLWQKAHQILAEDQPYMFLWVRKGMWFADKRFQNVKVTKLGLNDYEEWFVPRDRQKWTK